MARSRTQSQAGIPWQSYSQGELLAWLRKDLQLDPATDLLTTPLGAATAGGVTKLDCGVVTLTWPGATPFAGNMTVSHNLGTVPKAVLLGSSFMSAAPFAFEPFVNSVLGATSFVLSGNTPGATPAAATTGLAWWLALV